MKKKAQLLVFAILLSHFTFADMAPLAMIPGGSLVPANNNEIQMKSEVITITLYPNYYLVKVDYIFNNHGDAQKVAMGFPSKSWETDLTPTDFKAFDGEESIYIYPSEGSWDYTVKSKYFHVDNCGSAIDQFLCCNVEFEKGEEKLITNTYKAEYGKVHIEGNYGIYDHLYFNYILKTGSLWKDSIESIQVIVNSENVIKDFKLAEAYFQDEIYSLTSFDTTYYNIDPMFDLAFLVKIANTMEPYRTSSNLFPQAQYTYEKDNLNDRNSKTAWVEGVGGYGINEYFVYETTIGVKWGEDIIQVDSIGIINGYAFNDTIFAENSRVKAMKINSGYHFYYDNDNGTYFKYSNNDVIIELKDTQEIQYFLFDPPLKASYLVFTIQDVYKGTKYADTAISEVQVFGDAEYNKPYHFE
ncbi:MAG: hypothetical protein C0596_18055 [Marinilabiliales bacterium]|nr:MAG: hypothetical protein C0596_18055 [Marinilabiliales bacterium]